MEEFARAKLEAGPWDVEDATLQSLALTQGLFHVIVRGPGAAKAMQAPDRESKPVRHEVLKELQAKAGREFYGITVKKEEGDPDLVWVSGFAKGLVYPIDLDVSTQVGKRFAEIVRNAIEESAVLNSEGLEVFF